MNVDGRSHTQPPVTFQSIRGGATDHGRPARLKWQVTGSGGPRQPRLSASLGQHGNQIAHHRGLAGTPDGIAETMLRKTVVEVLARDSKYARRERFVAARSFQRPQNMIAFNLFQ